MSSANPTSTSTASNYAPGGSIGGTSPVVAIAVAIVLGIVLIVAVWIWRGK